MKRVPLWEEPGLETRQATSPSNNVLFQNHWFWHFQQHYFYCKGLKTVQGEPRSTSRSRNPKAHTWSPRAESCWLMGRLCRDANIRSPSTGQKRLGAITMLSTRSWRPRPHYCQSAVLSATGNSENITSTDVLLVYSGVVGDGSQTERTHTRMISYDWPFGALGPAVGM